MPDGLRLVLRLLGQKQALLDTSETGKRIAEVGADDGRQESHHRGADNVKALFQGGDHLLVDSPVATGRDRERKDRG